MIQGTALTRRVRRASRRPRHIAARGAHEHGASERIQLIEFRWLGPAGFQPVMLVHRELLH